jgi:glutathione S-transferase
MAIEIHWGSGSPFSWRVLLALEYKRLPYESRLMEFSKGQHRSPEFLAINPRGQVPALRDGDYAVYESIAILHYLERRYPEPALFGATPQQHGQVAQALQECALYLDGAGEDFILPMYGGEAAAREKQHQVRAALPRVHAELAHWERTLAGRDWLVLDGPSAADLAVFSMVKSLQRGASKPWAAEFDPRLLPFAQTYPRIDAWLGRIEQLPGYERTYPPHWRS